MSKRVFMGGEKGGSTKTTMAHLICLGATLRNQPADYLLTDPRRELKDKGRPYSVLDGRAPVRLAQILEISRNTGNGWLIIDGGGNRPAFDEEMTAEADLTLLPFRDSEEDLEAAQRGLTAYPQALAWPAAWPTNLLAQESAKGLIDALSQAFPGRVLLPPVYFVNSAKELLAETLTTASTPTRREARRAFDIMAACFEAHAAQKKTKSAGQIRAVA